MLQGNPKYRVLYTVWAFFECLGFGGLLYGWGSLVYVLKDEGLYLDLCADANENATLLTTSINYTNSNSNTIHYSVGNISAITDSPGSEPQTVPVDTQRSCDERDSKLALVFTIGAVMFCVGCFVMGQVNYKFGTRISRIGAAILFIVGALCIAFTSNDVPWLVFPGLSLIGAGGITYLSTNMQISFLFPSGGSAIVGLFCGGFDASSGIQLMVKLGYENGISRKISYLILAFTHVLTFISTFLFLPKDYIKKPSVAGKTEDGDDKEAEVELTSKNKEIEAMEEKTKQESLMSCILSLVYIPHVLYISILQLRFYFLLGSLNKTLNVMLDSRHEEVSHYTNVSMYVLMCGLITSPLAGIVCDLFTRPYKNSRSALRRVLMPSVIPLTVTTSLCIIMSGLILVEDPTVLYAVFIFLLFFRSFLYTLAAGYIGAIFPGDYFGILYGILIITGGIISMFQYALFTWAEASGFRQVNIFLLALMFVTYAHPLMQWLTCRRAERKGILI